MLEKQRIVEVECPLCHGEGVLNGFMSYEYKCNYCEGKGTVKVLKHDNEND